MDKSSLFTGSFGIHFLRLYHKWTTCALEGSQDSASRSQGEAEDEVDVFYIKHLVLVPSEVQESVEVTVQI